MGNLERDIKRVQLFYTQPPFLFNGDIYKELEMGWFTEAWIFMEEIKDISEEFHREYCHYYRYTHWIRVVEYQTKLSEQFYEDAFNNIKPIYKAILIKHNKVSQKFINDNKDNIPSEVWRKVYE